MTKLLNLTKIQWNFFAKNNALARDSIYPSTSIYCIIVSFVCFDYLCNLSVFLVHYTIVIVIDTYDWCYTINNIDLLSIWFQKWSEYY